jgi:hypothetical protein
MIRAMELKNLSPHTQRAYLAAVTRLARHYRQSPVGITKEMIEDYLLLLKESQSSNSCGLVLTGLRFFYTHVTEQKLRVHYRMRKKRFKHKSHTTVQRLFTFTRIHDPSRPPPQQGPSPDETPALLRDLSKILESNPRIDPATAKKK